MPVLTDGPTPPGIDVQDLIYTVSHDFQAPVRHIRAFLEVLAAHTEGQLDEEAIGYIDRVANATDTLQNLLDGLTGYSRVVTRAEEPVECDPGELIREVLATFEESIASTSVEIDDLTHVRADREQLSAVFAEIISNSLRFCGECVAVRVSCENAGERVLFRVADDGPGFSCPDSQAPFELFRRFHPVGVSGAGAGLAIVKRVIERHGGTVRLMSSPCAGTTTTFSLPVACDGKEGQP